MPDIEFECPSCRQRLEADTTDAGSHVLCPSCSADVMVPGVPKVKTATPVRFHCPHCSKSLEATADDAGTDADCPSCGNPFRVPVPSRDSLTGWSQAVQLNPRCPSCGAEMGAGHVVCIQCGQNLQTGRKIEQAAEVQSRTGDRHAREAKDRTRRWAVVLAVLALIVTAGAGLAHHVMKRNEARIRSAAFTSAADLGRVGRPTEDAVRFLQGVVAKYPEAQETAGARRILDDFTAARDRQRASVEEAIRSARASTGQRPDFDNILAALDKTMRENPDAPNLDDARAARDEVTQAKQAYEKRIADEEWEKHRQQEYEKRIAEDLVGKRRQEEERQRQEAEEERQRRIAANPPPEEERTQNISSNVTTPPQLQVGEGRPDQGGTRVFSEEQYIASHYERYGGTFGTAGEAAQTERALNTQMKSSTDAGTRRGNPRLGRWTYKYDRTLGKFVVFQE